MTVLWMWIAATYLLRAQSTTSGGTGSATPNASPTFTRTITGNTSDHPFTKKIIGGLKASAAIDADQITLRLTCSPESPGVVFPIAEAKSDTNSHVLIELFYWQTLDVGAAKPLRVLLHKTSMCPLLAGVEVMCDDVRLPFDAIEFVRLKFMAERSELEIWRDDSKVKPKRSEPPQ